MVQPRRAACGASLRLIHRASHPSAPILTAPLPAWDSMKIEDWQSALSLIQPAQMSVLVTTFSGRLMLLGAALLEIVGFFAVQRAATVKF